MKPPYNMPKHEIPEERDAYREMIEKGIIQMNWWNVPVTIRRGALT